VIELWTCDSGNGLSRDLGYVDEEGWPWMKLSHCHASPEGRFYKIEAAMGTWEWPSLDDWIGCAP
jgi:hypothetical protein